MGEEEEVYTHEGEMGVEVGRGLEEKGRFQAEGHLPFSLPTVRMGEELALKAMTSARLRLSELSLGS